MRFLAALGIFMSVFAGSLCWAGADFVLTQIEGLSAPILLPRTDTQTAEQAVSQYQRDIRETSLADLWTQSQMSSAESEMRVLNSEPSFFGAKRYVLIIANKASDLKAGSHRIENVSRLWRAQGFEPVVLALGAGVGLPPVDRKEFNEKISERFEVLMALGGDDVEPRLYGEKKTHSEYTHPLRDQMELDVIRTFKNREKGMFIGICRGHQMGAIADGHTLYQDLVKDGIMVDDRHRSGKHPLAMTQQMQEFLGIRRSEITVNSIHHQAVRINPDGKSQAISYSTEGVIEALEMKNGKGISFQFHPEIMAEVENTTLLDRYLGNKFFTALTKKLDSIRKAAPLCRRTLL